MFKLAVAMTKQAVADRKGVTAMEYAIIAAAIAAVVIAAFNGLEGQIAAVLGRVTSALGS